MKHNPRYQQLRELSWRRQLTPAEAQELQSWLTAHPEAPADWEAEAGLTEALRRLPDVAVPSNFTARVLQAVERDETATARSGRTGGQAWWRPSRWLPRVAFAAMLVGLGLGSYHVGERVRTAQLANSVETVAHATPAPNPEILQDFDAIRALPTSPAPDVELLALLQ